MGLDSAHHISVPTGQVLGSTGECYSLGEMLPSAEHGLNHSGF